jgi:8-oxo-dGTP diphosphatase
MSGRKQVAVAAAVILRDGAAGRECLLGRRAAGTFYPGYWEFPGGKVEAGERPADALTRELDEELGIRVLECTPWITLSHEYEHAHVRLHFFRVSAWSGEPQAHVHDALSWQPVAAPTVRPMLPANGPVLKSLRLPGRMAVTHAWRIGAAAQLDAIARACAREPLLLQIREPGFDDATRAFAARAIACARASGSIALVNGDVAAAQSLGADGVHLKSDRLATLQTRPPMDWVGASCHTADDIARAQRLGLDYVVVGPVLPTATHPGAAALGWPALTGLIAGCAMPVFAIGGLDTTHMAQALASGAHGIAAIRGAWQD